MHPRLPDSLKTRIPRLACEWFLVTRAFGTSGPYFHEEDALRDASQWSRYLLYKRWVIRGTPKLAEAKGDWSDPA
jgi:hypothetical protein